MKFLGIWGLSVALIFGTPGSNARAETATVKESLGV